LSLPSWYALKARKGKRLGTILKRHLKGKHETVMAWLAGDRGQAKGRRAA